MRMKKRKKQGKDPFSKVELNRQRPRKLIGKIKRLKNKKENGFQRLFRD